MAKSRIGAENKQDEPRTSYSARKWGSAQETRHPTLSQKRA